MRRQNSKVETQLLFLLKFYRNLKNSNKKNFAECGIQALRPKGGIQGLSKMAEPGDWPWHVALLKEDVHVCDATLVADSWLITTASCFQGWAF